MKNKRGWSLDSLVLIFSIVVFAQALVFVVPQGSYERVPYPDNPDRAMVVPGSYQPATGETRVDLRPWYFLEAIPKGLAAAHEIIFLVFIAGGVIALLRRSGAIDAALHRAVAHLGGSPWILIAGCLVLFSLGAWTIGMGEEYVPLVPILVTMSLAMRMDAIVAMALVWVPYGIGWATAGVNPFGVIIAQNIAGVPLTSGWAVRLVMMAAFLAIAFHHIYRYAMRVRSDPQASLVAHVDYSRGFDLPKDIAFDPRRVAIVTIFLAAIALFVWGVGQYGWYINELSAVFLGVGVATAIIARIGAGEASRTFIEGCAEMTGAALLIGVARSIEVVLADGQIIDTVIDAIAGPLGSLGAEASVVGMLVVQTVCNFFIPSGSGQAFVTMPIMSPLATLTEVPQQSAVLAYQFGDGFTNMVIPTSALVMGALALGKIPYGAWVRFVTPLLLKMFALAAMFLVLSLHLGEGLGF